MQSHSIVMKRTDTRFCTVSIFDVGLGTLSERIPGAVRNFEAELIRDRVGLSGGKLLGITAERELRPE
jgi:hypothetical protein